MWFRNLQIYRLTKPFELSGEALSEQLQTRPSRACGSLEPFSEGWEPPLGREGTLLTHTVADCSMLCLRREDRLLPSTVINEQLAERVETLEAREGRQVRRRERAEIKDNLVLELLPKAFIRSTRTYAYIDRGNGWLLVDTPSTKRAEEFVTLLRETLGSLPVRPLESNVAPASIMTGWLDGEQQTREFDIGDECELRDPLSEGTVVRCRRQDLTGEEIAAHLRAGKQVVKLALEWHERIGLLLSDDLAIKRLRFLDLVQEEAADSEAEDAVDRFDVDFALMSLELGKLVPRLLEAFGGVKEKS